MSDKPANAGSSYFHNDWYTELRDRLAEAQNWKCCYCGVVMNRWRRVPTRCTIEHAIPVSAGGRLCWETCAAACDRCNQDGGFYLMKEGRLPLTKQFCPWCGSDAVRMIRRILKCDLCRRQFSDETTSDLPFARVSFAALRLTAGKMIVSQSDSDRIAMHLKHQTMHLGFMPVVLAQGLMRMAADPIDAAQKKSDDLLEIYNDAINTLLERYTPTCLRPPRGGRLANVHTID